MNEKERRKAMGVSFSFFKGKVYAYKKKQQQLKQLKERS